MFRSILVPLDGSAFGEHALPWALSLARRAGAAIEVMHVHPPLAMVYPESVPLMDDSLNMELKTRQRAYLDNVVARLRSVLTTPVNCIVQEGLIAPTIQHRAIEQHVDLVVMTTHARGPLGRLWLGSVADELVRLLPMPMLLVRPSDSTANWQADVSFKHLLLPLDGSSLAEQMIEPATALGQLMGADYTLLRVIRPVMPTSYAVEGYGLGQVADSLLTQIERTHAQLADEAQRYLDEVASRLRAQGLTVHTRVATDEQPAVAILNLAVPPAIDFIALETHGRRGFSRWFLGSVADKVLRGTTLPVMVHKPKEA
ncbi:MAG: universal stress protein [Gemmataceae bacterium]|nr:universal stress protein [Gemmataceae bacterium]MDW8267515.1 universal stress protein [Gemmataceae bacterium]